MKISARNILLGALIAMGVSASTAASVDMLTEWYSFPSADWRNNANPQKVTHYCPTERYVFAVIHGNIYVNNANSYVNNDFNYNRTACTNLFVYDNQDPGKGFRGVSALFPDCEGMMVSAIGYNREKDYLVVAYQNGLVELLHFDGRVAKISDFTDAKIPGSKRVNSISFPIGHDEIYLGTECGYIVIDDSKEVLKEWVKLGDSVDYVNRMGDTLVAVAKVKTLVGSGETAREVSETTLVTYNLSNGSPSDMTDFTPIRLASTDAVPKAMVNTTTGNLLVSDGVLPMTDKTFVTVGRKGDANASANSIISLTLQDDGSYRALKLADTFVTAPSTAANQGTVVFSPLSGGINVTRDGYCVKNQQFHFLKSGIDPDFTVADPLADYKSKVYQLQSFSVSGLTYSNGASYDRENFWVFKLCGASDVNGGFVKYVKGADGKLAVSGSPIHPDGPMNLFGRQLSYAPGYGMVIPGREYQFYLMWSTGYNDFMSLYDGEKWTPFSVNTIYPSLSGMWAAPQGVLVDPENPKYVYSGSYARGLLRKNIEEPTDMLHIAIGGQYNASRACDVEVTPGYSSATGHTNSYMSRPSFDGEGRMWCAGFNEKTMNNPENNLPLFYWEKEDRIASVNKESYRPMKYLTVTAKNAGDGGNKADFIALSHPKNRNRLVYFSGLYSSPLYLIDHNGTPGDTSDDNVVYATGGYDGDSRKMIWDYIYGLHEDPVDGRIWIFTGTGLYWMDTDEYIKNPGMLHRTVVKRFEGRDIETVVGECAMPMGFAVDSKNRKWIGFNGGGIICLSPDNDEQLAHFDTQNSSLMNDVVFGLGWYPDHNSLMISTQYGYQEMKILEGVEESRNGAVVFPSSVDPGYNGFVTVRGLADAHKYNVHAYDGTVVAELGSPENGDLQWSLSDSSGKRVAHGIYSIYDKTSYTIVGKVVVVE